MAPPIFMIHGYNHSTKRDDRSPFRPGGNFDLWPQIFPDRECTPFAWESGLQGRDWWKAAMAGCWNTYQWAYAKLAPQAVDRAVVVLDQLPGKHDMICHSLGTLVGLKVLQALPGKFRKVILWNGAVTVDDAMPILLRNKDVQFLNVAVKEDDIVGTLGSWFEPKVGKHGCIGNGIPAAVLPDNVEQVVLDDLATQRLYKARLGWDLQGDDPSSYGDHSFSFEHKGNWPLYRRFMA